MADYMIQRGKNKIWYARKGINGIRLRDCLGTSDERLARKRMAELELAVERGEYHAYKRDFMLAVEEFLPTASQREEMIIRCHLIPYFKRFKVGEINDYEIYNYNEIHNEKPESSLKKELRCLKKIMTLGKHDFKLPKLKFANKGKRFDETQILEESDILDVIDRHILEIYRIPCLISAYSSLRMGNVIGLKKRNVNLKTGWIEVKQTKTGRPVSIPICGKLRAVFRSIKVLPMGMDDYFFPDLSAKAMSTCVRRGFKRAGFEWASFHHFRHFAGCFLINNGVDIAIVQKIMGHADIRSTLVYARLKRETLKEAMNVFDIK